MPVGWPRQFERPRRKGAVEVWPSFFGVEKRCRLQSDKGSDRTDNGVHGGEQRTITCQAAELTLLGSLRCAGLCFFANKNIKSNFQNLVVKVLCDLLTFVSTSTEISIKANCQKFICRDCAFMSLEIQLLAHR
jgi:hypothetical protein